MRLLLKRGKQKELIRNFRKGQKITVKEVAEYLKIKEGRLHAYFHETSNIPEEIYKKLDNKNKYKKYIIERREENWGQSKGGRLSKGNTKKIKLPKESRELAEIYGIMLGDGNSYKLKRYKIGTYTICITGDKRFDKKYLLGYVKPLIEKLFDTNVRIKELKNKNVIIIFSDGINLINFFETKGFKPGNKIKNQLGIPSWIKNNKEFLKACLRGLYDTDGSIYKLTNQNTFQITFRNYNETLMKDVRNSLLYLGIKCSKISGHSLYITKKSEIANFFKLVGFNNPRHLNRIKVFSSLVV